MLRGKQEIYMKKKVKTHSGDVNTLRPQKNESGETELRNFGEKSQDKNELILHKTINFIWNQITDMIQLFNPLYQDS